MHNQLCCTVTLSIAVGCTRHWLAAKCASRSVKQAMTALLAPHQLGFGTVIQSAKGVQQGDPPGPLVVLSHYYGHYGASEIWTVHLLSRWLHPGRNSGDCSPWPVGSGAGGRAIGPPFEPIGVGGHCQGLQHSATMLEVAPNLCLVSPELATHLGSPIGGQEGMDESIHE